MRCGYYFVANQTVLFSAVNFSTTNEAQMEVFDLGSTDAVGWRFRRASIYALSSSSHDLLASRDFLVKCGSVLLNRSFAFGSQDVY